MNLLLTEVQAQAQVIDAIDKASAASDRWLFIAAIIIIMMGGLAIIRYLVSLVEKQNQFITDNLQSQIAIGAKALIVLERIEPSLKAIEHILAQNEHNR